MNLHLKIYKKIFFLTKKVFNFDTLSHIVSKAEMRNTLYRKSTMEINQISRIRWWISVALLITGKGSEYLLWIRSALYGVLLEIWEDYLMKIILGIRSFNVNV